MGIVVAFCGDTWQVTSPSATGARIEPSPFWRLGTVNDALASDVDGIRSHFFQKMSALVLLRPDRIGDVVFPLPVSRRCRPVILEKRKLFVLAREDLPPASWSTISCSRD